MVKKCPIILNNEAVTVAKFGDIEVQFPSIRKQSKTVLIKFENGSYSIINEQEYKAEKENTKPKRKTVKKTTIKESKETEQ